MMRRRLGRSEESDAGFGMVELIVAISLTAIMATVVIGVLVSITRTFSHDSLASESTNVAAVGMQELTRVIRSGTEIPVKNQLLNNPVFVQAKSDSITLHAFLDTDSAAPEPVKIQFWVNGTGELVETRWAAYPVFVTYWAFDAAPVSSRVVARKIVRSATIAPIFSYLRADGTVMTLAANAALTASQIREVAAVKVQITVQADPQDRIEPVSIENTVGIPNLGISRVGAGS